MEIRTEVMNTLGGIINNPEYSHLPKQFAFCGELEQHALLFIGINPSSIDNAESVEVYSLTGQGNQHTYFRKFEEVAQYCGTKWTHLDLLYFRETNQELVHNIISDNAGLKYLWEQLQLSDRLIKRSKPQAIVVCNTLARRFFGLDKRGTENVWLNYDLKFDEDLGTYLWKDVPVFFSGMLTGQRALDNESFKRLKWQIRRALNVQLERKLKEISALKRELVDAKKYEEVARLRDIEKEYLEKLVKGGFSLDRI